jgi:hypothetical protein
MNEMVATLSTKNDVRTGASIYYIAARPCEYQVIAAQRIYGVGSRAR